MLEFEADLSSIRTLGDFARRLTDFRVPLAEAGALLERRAKLRFAREEDPDGNRWAALKPRTAKLKKTRAYVRREGKKVRVSFPTATLRETGIMAASIKFLPPTKDTVRVVSPTEYSIFHQTGTKYMPARPILGINQDDVNAIRGIFADYIEGR